MVASRAMERTSETKNIAVLFSLALKGQRMTFRGILDYASKHGPWFCKMMEGRIGEQELGVGRKGEIDGVIMSKTKRRTAEKVAALGVPVVFVEPFPEMKDPGWPIQGAPWVGRDSFAIGAEAARYYLERGYRHFAYVDVPTGSFWSAERRRGFAETLAAAGYGHAVYDRLTAREKRSWPLEKTRMVKFLLSLPRPTAVFAPMDGRARLVLDACQAVRLRVPEEIAVLGVDNDTLLCESTVPALSSIHTGGFRRGRIAAEMLDDLMHGREPREHAVPLPPISVVTRGSTGYDAMSDTIIGRAVEFLRAKAGEGGVSVPEVARAAGCSRSYLDKSFRARIGMSVQEAVLKMRLDFVKELLSTTNRSMTEIVQDCGFARSSHLAFLFKKATGRTMLQWRRENRETPDE